MARMWWKAENNNLVVVTVVDKLFGAMQAKSIKE